MYPILERDAALRPFERDINLRMDNYYRMHELLTNGRALSDFAKPPARTPCTCRANSITGQPTKHH